MATLAREKIIQEMWQMGIKVNRFAPLCLDAEQLQSLRNTMFEARQLRRADRFF